MSSLQSRKRTHKLLFGSRASLSLKAPKLKALRPSRGRKGKLSDTHVAWIICTEPEYESKIALYNGKCEDDEDLKEWVDRKWSLFSAEFKYDFVNSSHPMKEWERCFRNRYYNHRFYILRKDVFKRGDLANDASSTSSDTNQSELGKEHSESTATYNDDKARKESFPMRCRLTQIEKDEWHRVARTHDVDMVYENQTKFSSVIYETITRSQGFEAHQSGDSAHLVVSTFRDKDGLLQNHLLVIEGQNPGAKQLLEMFPNLKSTKLLSEWDKYTAQAIPDTLAERYVLEKLKENPPPLLKEAGCIEEEDNLTPAAIRVMLEEHFVNLWAFAQGDSNREIPWDDVIKNPQAFISKASLPPSISFTNPHRMNRDHLHHLRTLILDHQKSSPLEPYIHFLDKSAPKTVNASGYQGSWFDTNTSLRLQECILSTPYVKSEDNKASLKSTRDSSHCFPSPEGALPKKRSKGPNSATIGDLSRGSSGEKVELGSCIHANSGKRTHRMTENALRFELHNHNNEQIVNQRQFLVHGESSWASSV